MIRFEAYIALPADGLFRKSVVFIPNSIHSTLGIETLSLILNTSGNSELLKF